MPRPFLENMRTTSAFGPRPDPFGGMAADFHEGIDFRANYDPLYAPEASVVLRIANDPLSGLNVLLGPDSEPGIYLAFCHLSHVLCSEGEKLAEGTVFAVTGNSGRSTAPHLHFGIRRRADKGYVDPTAYLEKIQSPILAGIGSATLPGLALVAVGIGLLIFALTTGGQS